MKLECGPPHGNGGYGVRIFICAIALISLACLLVSCAKKAAPPPTDPHAGQLTTQPAQSLYGKAMQHAVGVAGCQPNLEQVRSAIQMYRDDHDRQNPQSLQALELPPKTLSCPVGQQPYQYDPATGEVKCTFPGHAQY